MKLVLGLLVFSLSTSAMAFSSVECTDSISGAKLSLISNKGSESNPPSNALIRWNQALDELLNQQSGGWTGNGSQGNAIIENGQIEFFALGGATRVSTDRNDIKLTARGIYGSAQFAFKSSECRFQ